MISFNKKAKKIGAALGSGGAKGMAHLGALQAFAENGVRFDVYAGTSAGAIIGALAAKGYSPSDMRELLAGLDYKNLALSVLASGSLHSVFRALDDILGESGFSELSKPFAAIATDVETGREAVFREGNVARAVLASSAMPPFFRSVEIEGKRYADGAFCNAVPGDAAKDLGADFVIGVALSPAEAYRNTSFITASGEQVSAEQKGFSRCDVLLEPDLSAYSAGDVFAGSRMYDIGYECAQRRMPEILRLLRAKKIVFE